MQPSQTVPGIEAVRGFCAAQASRGVTKRATNSMVDPRGFVKRAWMIASLLAVLVVGLSCYLFLLPAEPSFEGRSLSKWLVDLDVRNAPGAQARDRAVKAV